MNVLDQSNNLDFFHEIICLALAMSGKYWMSVKVKIVGTRHVKVLDRFIFFLDSLIITMY